MKKGFDKFHKAFIELIEKYGAKLAPEKEWATLPSYNLETKWGNLRLSIHSPTAYSTHRYQGIYLSFRNYSGPTQIPIDNMDWNWYSHKWNIGVSGGDSIEDCRKEALRRLETRLETLKNLI